jgi:dolichyl-phosphate beta-glucosyltransferase
MNKLSIIIPCYNSSQALETNLPYLIDFCSTLNIESEIIIIDDGSLNSDDTAKIALTNCCDFYGYTNNKGKGNAVRYGISKAKGDIILFTDADIPFEGDAILKAIHYLIIKEYDLVIGDRGLEESDYFNKVSNERRFGSGLFTFFVGRFVTTGFSDTQCGFKAFRKEIAEDLFSKSLINGFSFDVEIIYIALKRNYDIKKIPVILRSQDGNSVSVLKHGMGMLFDLFRIKWYHLKGKYNK